MDADDMDLYRLNRVTGMDLYRLFYDYYTDDCVLRINHLDGRHSVRMVGDSRRFTGDSRAEALHKLCEAMWPELIRRETARRLGSEDKRRREVFRQRGRFRS